LKAGVEAIVEKDEDLKFRMIEIYLERTLIKINDHDEKIEDFNQTQIAQFFHTGERNKIVAMQMMKNI
jgi:hypothetical protein